MINLCGFCFPAAHRHVTITNMIKSCGRSHDNYFTKMCIGSEAGSYLGLIDFAYHSILGLRVIQ